MTRMNHHAYQWRPIRGRRFDSGRLLGTLMVIGGGAFGIGVLIVLSWTAGVLLPIAERYLP